MDFVVCVVIAAVFAYGRRDFVLTRLVLNPDEAEMLAAGKRAALTLVPFRDFAVGTYGPVWPTLLGVLHRMGLPLTVPVAHLLSAVAGAACCATVAVALRRSAGWIWATVVTVPLVAHWSMGFYSSDFVAMATETLPLCFLVAACAVGFSSPVVSHRRAVTSAVLFGLVMSAKYAFAPVVLMGLIALVLMRQRAGARPLRSVALVGSLAVAPYTAFMAVAVVAGVPFWKISESFVFNWNYARAGGVSGGLPLTVAQRLDETWTAVTSLPSLLVGVAVIVGAVVVQIARRSFRAENIDAVLLACALASIAVSVLLLYLVYPVHPHYSYLYIGGCLQALLLCRTVVPRVSWPEVLSTVGGRVGLFGTGLALTAMVAWVPTHVGTHPPAPSWKTTWGSLLSADGGLMTRLVPAQPGDPTVESLCPRGSRVLVWGWEPGPYSYYDWQPASRYVVTTGLIQPNRTAADPSLYRPRLLAELVAQPPDCIVEATRIFGWRKMGDTVAMTAQMPEAFRQIPRAYVDHQLMWDATIPVTVHVGR